MKDMNLNTMFSAEALKDKVAMEHRMAFLRSIVTEAPHLAGAAIPNLKGVQLKNFGDKYLQAIDDEISSTPADQMEMIDKLKKNKKKFEDALAGNLGFFGGGGGGEEPAAAPAPAPSAGGTT